MSSFKSLKALFFVSEPEVAAVQTPVAASSATTTISATPNYQPPPAVSVSGGQKNTPDAQIIETLQKALDANNQPGYDYLEYRQGLIALQSIIADPETRFRSVYAAAVPMGASKTVLVTSAAQYKKVLETQKTEFEQALNGQIDRNLTQKKQHIQELQNQTEAKKQQIQELNQQIITLQTQIQESQQSIAGAESKINTTRHNFDVAYQTVVSSIDQDISHINAYLQG